VLEALLGQLGPVRGTIASILEHAPNGLPESWEWLRPQLSSGSSMTSLCSGIASLWAVDFILSGTFSGYRVAYLANERDLGVITEIFSTPTT
jgi:hypothetical protein